MVSMHTARATRAFAESATFRRTPLAAAVAFALAAGAPLAYAGPPAPGAALGDGFQVNQAEVDTPGGPRIATDAAGDFVVVWSNADDADGDGFGIFARRYRADGTPLGDEFQVNTHTAGNQMFFDVAMDPTGDFVVAWTDKYGVDGDGYGVVARRYNSEGEPLDSSDFQVNTSTSGDQGDPAVAMDAKGNFVVAWRGDSGGYSDIFARRFNADGTPPGTGFPVNTHTSGAQFVPAVAMDAAGDFVVAWEDDSSADGDGWGIFARRYDKTGVALDSNDIPVNVQTAGDQQNPAAATDAAGDFVVAWTDRNGVDGDSLGIFARRFRADGTPLGGDLQVNTHTAGIQMLPAVAMDAAGSFLVAWEDRSGADGDGDGVFARRYGADGMPLGGGFQINSHTVDSQNEVTVAMNAAGDFVAGWRDDSAPGGQAMFFARRYARESSLDLKAILAVAPADTVAPGADVTLTASVANVEEPSTLIPANPVVNAALTGATGLTATLTLPDNVAFSKATGTSWTCPAAPVDHKLTCTYAATLAAASATENLVVSLTAPDTDGARLQFSSAIFGGQPDTVADNNIVKADITVRAPADDSDGNDSDGGDDTGGNNTNPPASSSSGGGGGFGWLGVGLMGFAALRRRSSRHGHRSNQPGNGSI